MQWEIRRAAIRRDARRPAWGACLPVSDRRVKVGPRRGGSVMGSTDGGIFQMGLGRTGANFAPLTPLGFLPRSASIYPDRVAVVHGDRRLTYREFDLRARR